MIADRLGIYPIWIATGFEYDWHVGCLSILPTNRFRDICRESLLTRTPIMLHELLPTLVAAADYSLIYLLGGGGVFGAVVIFILAKFLGK